MSPKEPHLSHTRRRFLGGMTLATAAFSVPGAFAEELTRTAWVEEGPFYPPRLPLDTDNDLLIINDAITPAVGEITHLSGRLLDARGNPIKNAVVEVWQVDSKGIYLAQGASFDPHFQGFGRFMTGSTGEYYFRTVKPVPYGGRQAAHIHYKVKMKGRDPWTTQLFIQGFPGNTRDGVYGRIGNAQAQASVTVPFTPVASSSVGELAAKFDIILGFTPEV
jgi:protocatechuate 3,4-dioxygenase beta subunit